MSDENERKYVPMDDVFTGVEKTVKFLNYMLAERSQLYGTIIYLMQMLEMKNIPMPPVQSMQEYHNSFTVKFDLDDGVFTLSLVERESIEPGDLVAPPDDEENDEDGSESS